MNIYDYLIVGSGLFGATFAYRAHQMGKKCLVIDKRPHLGGNIYCEEIEGINVHVYGAHIFHTNNKKVWDFVNCLVPFNRYTNCPVAQAPDGKLYNLPFNMNTFYQIWGVKTPAEAQAKLNEQRFYAIEKMKSEGVKEPRNLEEQALSLIGKDIYDLLIKGYTEKQWGRDCKHLPAFIIRRIPVRMTYDNNYFNDKYQGIPIGGYNKLIEVLLKGNDCLVNTDFFKATIADLKLGINSQILDHKCLLKESWRKIAQRLVYTGAVDEYFEYKLGKLDWRTVSFKTRVEEIANYQGNAVVNYTGHEVPFTRIIEHKHFEMFGQEVYDCPRTIISEEYSTEFKDGMEPYYPVNDERNNSLAEEYRKLAEKEDDIIFGGRLGRYQYYDMAPVIENVMNIKI